MTCRHMPEGSNLQVKNEYVTALSSGFCLPQIPSSMTKSAPQNIPLIRGSKNRGWGRVRKVDKVSIFSLELLLDFGPIKVLRE